MRHVLSCITTAPVIMPNSKNPFNIKGAAQKKPSSISGVDAEPPTERTQADAFKAKHKLSKVIEVVCNERYQRDSVIYRSVIEEHSLCLVK